MAKSPHAGVGGRSRAPASQTRRSAQRTLLGWERPVAEVLRDATTDSPCFWFRGWAKFAAEADLKMVTDRLRAADDPREIRNLLFAFCARPMPDFDPSLLDLCRHADPELSRRAFMACGQVTHPAVRTFGLAELARKIELGGAVELLVHNFEPGDEARVLAALREVDDGDEWHSILSGVRDLLEANPEADPSGLGLVLYALNPCENCRRAAVQLLIARDAAPAWLIEECRHDNDERIREWVEFAPPGPGRTLTDP